MAKYLSPAKEILDLGADTSFKKKEGTEDSVESFYPDLELLSPPTRFSVKYLDTIKASESIDLYINANVVDIPLNDDLESVRSFKVKTFGDSSEEVQADHYVIALGAVENARLLLNCDSQKEGGLGNGGGMLGTCFMDHVNVRLGKFIPDKSAWKDGINSMAYYTGDDFIRSEGIGSSNVTMGYTATTESDGRGQAVKKFLAERACDWGFEDQLSNVFQFVCPEEGRLSTLTEQDPVKENRIYLSGETDELGLRRVSVDWTLSDFDKKTIKAVAEEFAIQAHKGDVARVKLPEFNFDETVKLPFYGSGYLVNGHAHHMGATRMATSEKDGVVDPNCRVFGTNNLYVAGSSVFPRGGAHNPTMPLVQLALRLADHLIEEDMPEEIQSPDEILQQQT
jgi:choline dehydrogenase-like flavoprotein